MLKKVMSSFLTLGLTAGLITSLGVAASALAATSPDATTDTTASPEMTLLQRTLALEGQNLTQGQMQARFSTIVADYATTAPASGQQDRMEQALVTLNMYTPQQAHQLMTDVEASSQTLTTGKFASQTALSAQASAEIARLASNYPAGAQFSGCELSLPVGLIGGAAFVTGAIIWALSTDKNGNDNLKSASEAMTATGAAGIVIGVVLNFTSEDGGC